MEGEKKKDFACCAHSQVIPMRIESSGKVFEEQWRCKDCGAKFVMLDGLFTGQQKIRVMEPVKTLRDEFAMAALCGFLSNTDTDLSKPNTVFARVSYQFADAMMESRK